MNQSSSERTRKLPPATRYLLGFQAFNAINFTIALGAPMVLLARRLGASDVAIGVINSIALFTVILQILAPPFIERIGPKRAMLMGWGLRSMMLTPVLFFPLVQDKVQGATLVLVLGVLMLLYSSIRGFASAAWLPWLSQLLPAEKRGLYFGSEQQVMNLTGFITLIFCGWFLGSEPGPWRYSFVYLICIAAGVCSVLCLNRTPDDHGVHVAKKPRRTGRSWTGSMMHVLADTSFRRTTLFVCVYTFALSAQGAFMVLFLREEIDFSEGLVLKLQAAATLGVFFTAVYWGRLSDRVGSRPLLRVFDIAIIGILVFWTVVAALHAKVPAWLVFTVYFAGGIFTAAHAVAQTRLVFTCCPASERTFGMALFAVTTAMCGGAAPIVFGFILEWMRPAASIPGEVPLSHGYTVIFGLMALLAIASQLLLSRVPELRRLPTHRVVVQVIYDWPIKVLSGVVSTGRRRGEKQETT